MLLNLSSKNVNTRELSRFIEENLSTGYIGEQLEKDVYKKTGYSLSNLAAKGSLMPQGDALEIIQLIRGSGAFKTGQLKSGQDLLKTHLLGEKQMADEAKASIKQLQKEQKRAQEKDRLDEIKRQHQSLEQQKTAAITGSREKTRRSAQGSQILKTLHTPTPPPSVPQPPPRPVKVDLVV